MKVSKIPTKKVNMASNEYLKLIKNETILKNRKLFEATQTLYSDRKILSEINKREKALKAIIKSYIVIDEIYKVGAYILKWTTGNRAGLNQKKLKEKYPEVYADCYEKSDTNTIKITKN